MKLESHYRALYSLFATLVTQDMMTSEQAKNLADTAISRMTKQPLPEQLSQQVWLQVLRKESV